MSDELTGEDCDECGSELIRTTADDPINPEQHPIVTCPGCLRRVRVER